MHIAVCDDNMADRHQMERLLQRESDRIKSTSEPLYVDSFGNSESLLNNPMQYDAFFLDVCHTENITGADVARKLTEAGVNAPIIMCCSNINYREPDFPVKVLFLEKPIKAEELHATILHAQKLAASAEMLIELREEKKTLYVKEEEILYAVEKDISTIVTLTDGRTIRITSNALNFFSQVERFPSFVDATRKVVLNCRYIQKLSLGKATMTDGAIFKVDRIVLPYVKEMMSKYD